MENVAVSRRKHNKGNKENAQPTQGSKSFIKRDKTTTVPFQLKSNKKEETVAKNGPLQAKAKQVDTRQTSGEVLKKVKTVQRAAATDVKQRQTHSKAFLTEQAVKDKKIVAEAPKPAAAVPPSKPAPGMYKGKIVQSKIGSIWKSSSSINGADPTPAAPKTEGQKVGNVTKMKCKSVSDLPHKAAQTRSRLGSDRPAQASKPAVTSRPPIGFCSARPPVRSVPATLPSTTVRNTSVTFTKRSASQNQPKPKIPVTDKKVNKPPVSSTMSQYRFTMDSAEERRAKLAEWLASKGKTLKRPAMAKAAPSKTKIPAKPQAELKPQSPPPAQCDPAPEPSVETHKPGSPAAAQCAETQEAELPTQSQTPAIMNTTLDLLENSDADLPVEPQERVDDIVVNLCDALEAMATPSKCNDELSQVADVCTDVEEAEDSKAKEECEKEDLKNEMPEDVSEQPKVGQVKDEGEESDDQDEEEAESDDDDDDDDDDDCVMETTPQMEDASVVKYSVKTTPYLQSVKRTIEDEVTSSASRRKSNIKDLKFLTPVRRSSRIQRKSSRLPSMLVDHDPCVSSLAELVKLDDDPNAYIYRRNPALLDDLPDQTTL